MTAATAPERVSASLPAAGLISVRRVLPAPIPGRIKVAPAIAGLRAPGTLPGGPTLAPVIPGSIPVDQPITTLPTPGRIWVGGQSPLPTPGNIHTGRVLDQPRTGRIPVGRVAEPPAPGRIRVEKLQGLPGRGGVSVPRVRNAVPGAGTRTADAQEDRTVGDTGLGTIRIADPVIARIAARAVLDVPDAGGVAPSVIGKLAGGHLGVRETSLDSIPKTTASVDGTRAFITTTVSVRWPAPIAATAQAVRESIRSQVEHMVGVEVPEVEVRVDALIERGNDGPRVR